jgi:ankyrin repeat protein
MLVKLLLDSGADSECTDKFGLTPLTWALENEHEQVAQLLIGWGANMTASNKPGYTPVPRVYNREMSRGIFWNHIDWAPIWKGGMEGVKISTWWSCDLV